MVKTLIYFCLIIGIHALGWSRKKAIEYMVENTAMSRGSIEREVDRYITLPGQACSYKIGEIKILELRRKAEHNLGDKFDLREFHRTILLCPGPINVLESCINTWLKLN